MERLLSLWIERQTHERIPTSQLLIQEKAKSLFQDLLKKYPEDKDTTFLASSGWFACFKRHFSLHNIKIQGEAAAADTVAAEVFPATLKKIIEDEGFSPEQIFNVDETGLFWKEMPDRSFISKEVKTMQGYKVAKERLTLMLGGNCTDDFKLKPLLVYHAANPRALENIPKASLPIIWMNNMKAWVTIIIFGEWFINHFIPAVKSYCREKKIQCKLLLILDNAPGHPTNLSDFDPNVKVVYLQPNTTSLIQPMDQGVIALFKCYYLRRTLRQAVDATSEEEGINIRKFWKNYNIYQAVLNINAAWLEVTQSAMDGVWKRLCPHLVNDFTGFDAPVKAVSKNLVSLSADLEMELEEEDFDGLIEADKQPLTLTNRELFTLMRT
uniref:tigger transposable element-derived protein 1-like n=1 Tax=Myxine glutinosa TaxID=7769 RepID=UPI00358EF1F2